MHILTMIRKNLPGKPDYIMTAEFANGRTMLFKTEKEAHQYFMLHFANSETFPVYGAKVVAIPEAA